MTLPARHAAPKSTWTSSSTPSAQQTPGWTQAQAWSGARIANGKYLPQNQVGLMHAHADQKHEDVAWHRQWNSGFLEQEQHERRQQPVLIQKGGCSRQNVRQPVHCVK